MSETLPCFDPKIKLGSKQGRKESEPSAGAESETLIIQSRVLSSDRVALDVVVLTGALLLSVLVEPSGEVFQVQFAVVLVHDGDGSVRGRQESHHRLEGREHVAVHDDGAAGGLTQVKTDAVRDIVTLDGEVCEVVGAHDVFSFRETLIIHSL